MTNQEHTRASEAEGRKKNRYTPGVGDRHGRLMVVKCWRSGYGWRCLCRCDCGNLREFTAGQLYWPKQRHNASCGCGYNLRHGHKAKGQVSPEYKSWRAMKSRCLNPNNPAYHNYGGRGITVCDRWSFSFEAFLSDMGPRPNNCGIGRIDNNGNYEPGNCQWETPKQNGNNTRHNRKLLFNGRIMTVAQWTRELRVSRSLFRNRLNAGWSTERTLGEASHAKQ